LLAGLKVCLVIRREKEVNNDKIEEIKARILGANKAYSSLSSLQSIYRSQQSHQNNKIRLYKTLFNPLFCYGSVTRALIKMTEQLLCSLIGKCYEEFKFQCRLEDADILDEIVKFIIYTKV
jgi:hypothetical protein